jgi:site-specific DNA-methyltransferase (adenine-specific)
MSCKINNSIIWYKRNAFPNITQRMLCESSEQIIWAVNNDRKHATKWVFNYNSLKNYHPEKKQLRNVWDIPMTKLSEKKSGRHPTQKPLEIAERLIVGFTNKNEIIIDPFAGSGTFLLSAKEHGRRYIGVENNEEYFKIAKARLS